MPKKKKFIDKKSASSFYLVHRSQQDPLAADENAPQRVLLPVSKAPMSDERKKRLEEQQKYGIYFDDDYNYLQHLKEADNKMEWGAIIETPAVNKNKLSLPSSVFASSVEEPVGLLNKAAPIAGPRLDLDPDVVAAMDDDFDYDNPDNELEDNFIELANAEGSDLEEEEYANSNMSSNFGDEELDDVPQMDGFWFPIEESKSTRFTEYSMSSSVVKRNEHLRLVDERFEKMCPNEYSEYQIGALDSEEIVGYIPEHAKILREYADEFFKNKALDNLQELSKNKVEKELVLKRLEGKSDSEDEYEYRAVQRERDWDCESILTTTSQFGNQPKTIYDPPKKRKIKVNKKTGMPMNVFDSDKLTTKQLTKWNEENDFTGRSGPKSAGMQSVASRLTELSIRNKDETLEEKRERKKEFKEYKRERRAEKKANIQGFSEERMKQAKITLNKTHNKLLKMS